MATVELTAGPSALPLVPIALPPATSVLPLDWTIADVLTHLGGIPPERVRLFPPPGTATEKDVEELDDHADRLCELIDGVLVEKTMGYKESIL
ncbi:MAG: hypothetical protein LLG00_14035, partial [Planctomycetaceae bacterium]|nr:hypothetical protein [Planctomycetaceae bacterium]